MLRVSPQQRPRLAEIIHNLHERITEAQMNGWLGEVQGLEVSLEAAKRKLAVSIRKSRECAFWRAAWPYREAMPW
jgi:hypothetical protein